MSFRSSIAIAAFLASAANAHVAMQEPIIFNQAVSIIDTAPLTAAQFPCKTQHGFEITKMNQMEVGKPQVVQLKGSAIHGGGSCQLSFTTDLPPTKDSVFKVIKSFEGGCPATENAKLEYTLPPSIPNGKGTFAWNWVSKMSGAPENYMNCAPVEVTGGASDTAAFKALPDLLKINLGGDSTCKSVANKAVKYPNPGADVVTGASGDAELPTGDCGATGATPPSNGDPATPPAAPPAAPPATPPAAPPATPPAGTPAVPSGGMDHAPPASSGTPPVVAPPAVSGAPKPPTTAPATPPTAPPAAPPATGGTTCTTNGAVVCNGPNQFALCNNGNAVWQDVAKGTSCVNGSIQKRSSFKATYNGRIVRKSIAFRA